MILGKFVKQPLEIKSYSIQFVDDMNYADSIVTGWQKIVRYGQSEAIDTTVANAPYTATLNDDKKCIHAFDAITLPVSAQNGYTLYIANLHQSNVVIVNETIVLNVRGAAVIVRENNQWVVEASTDALIVSMPNDHRMMTSMRGGKDKTVYKIDMLVTTEQGSTMQDEITVKIKET